MVPEHLRDHVRVGTLVRVQLHGRRVGAWVVATDVEPTPGLALKPIAKVTGWGPDAGLVDLAAWAAWRWAGRQASFLRTASPPGAVVALPAPPPPAHSVPLPADELLDDALGRDRGVLRLPPGADRYPLVLRAATLPGDALVLCPTISQARALATRLRRAGLPVACVAHDRPNRAAGDEWARAAAGGCTVIGARAGAWAPAPHLARVVMLDEHDEAYESEQSPTWHARDVVVERAARAGVPCLLVSPCPTLQALAWGDLVVPSRSAERAGWPALEVVDRRGDDPTKGGLYSDRLVSVLRGEGRVLCVVNRLGRSRLMACTACGALARCEVCGGATGQPDPGVLRCRRCRTERPVVCGDCGGIRFKNLRAGVSRVREEVEALAGEPVGEVTAASDAADVPTERVVVGTEAVLHRVGAADVVAFLDFDQELTAPRYRAAEEALALLALGARAVRGRLDHGRVLVQTRQPDHPVLLAALHADPGRITDSERLFREVLGLPPARALAVVSGPGAPPFVDQVRGVLGVDVEGPSDGAYRIRAADHRTLCDALAAAARPSDRLRIDMDPMRL